MAREVVQIIKCDNCDVQTDEDTLAVHQVIIDGVEYELELGKKCRVTEGCEGDWPNFSIDVIMDIGRMVRNHSKKKKSGGKAKALPFDPRQQKNPNSGKFDCPEVGCHHDSPSARGLGMHWHRAHGTS